MTINFSGNKRPLWLRRWRGVLLIIMALMLFAAFFYGLISVNRRHLHPDAKWSPWIINDVRGIKENADQWRQKNHANPPNLEAILHVDPNDLGGPRIVKTESGFFETKSGARVWLKNKNGVLSLVFDGVDEHSCRRMSSYFATELDTQRRGGGRWYAGLKVGGRELKLLSDDPKAPLTGADFDAAYYICDPDATKKERQVEWIGL